VAESTMSVSDHIEICYETFGDEADPAILMIMGLSAPMGWWSTELCESIAARGYRVIRFDNRDTGGSTKLHDRHVGRSDIVRTFLGERRPAPYTISELAGDAFGLLDGLGIERTHLVGASMGGMIAQTMAIERPERVASLTSMMSTTGRRTVGWQHPKLLPTVLARATPSRGAYVQRSLRMQELVGSVTYPTDRREVRERAEETYDRGWSASGVLRQMQATLSQPDRTTDLHRLDLPVCVIHGLEDPMIHPSGGRATAAAVPGSELILLPGLGHDLPRQLYPTFVDAIDRTARRSTDQPPSSCSSDSASSR